MTSAITVELVAALRAAYPAASTTSVGVGSWRQSEKVATISPGRVSAHAGNSRSVDHAKRDRWPRASPWHSG